MTRSASYAAGMLISTALTPSAAAMATRKSSEMLPRMVGAMRGKPEAQRVIDDQDDVRAGRNRGQRDDAGKDDEFVQADNTFGNISHSSLSPGVSPCPSRGGEIWPTRAA